MSAVGGLAFGVFVAVIDDAEAIAAGGLRISACGERIGDGYGRVGRARIDRADADAARAGDLFIADSEDLLSDLAQQVVAPDLDVARGATLGQDHESAIAEAAEQIFRQPRFADEPGKLTDEIFGQQRTQLIENRAQFVGFDGHELADAGLDRLRQPLLQMLDEKASLERACRRIVLERVRQLICERLVIALLGRDTKLDCRLPVELGARKLHFDLH
jgi:hypothetical protein